MCSTVMSASRAKTGGEGEARSVPVHARYGIVEGRLAFLSRDAINDEKLGLIFPTRIELLQSAIRVGPDQVTPLTAGMTVTAEVKTGRRRIIDFLLSPLARKLEEAARER
jgi:hypothetical protein